MLRVLIFLILSARAPCSPVGIDNDERQPMATYLGWNLRRTGFAEGALCSVTGFTIPLAATRAEREASGDPRLSID